MTIEDKNKNNIESCECPELKEFYSLMRRARELEMGCEEYDRECDDLGNPRDDSLRFYEMFGKRIDEFSEASEIYIGKMDLLIGRGVLTINQKIAGEYTINCAKCGHYVDSRREEL